MVCFVEDLVYFECFVNVEDTRLILEDVFLEEGVM